VSRRGAGPAQLRRRSKVRQLFQALVEWNQHQTALPNCQAVGAKIRLGNNAREQHFQVYLPVAEAAAETGLDYLTVHARHGEQRSRDPPTWEAIGEIKTLTKDSSDLKIIGNGDVRTPADVKRMQQLTGCDAVMIGRAAMRNPWCFRRLAAGWDDNNHGAAGAAGNANADDDPDHHDPNEWPTLAEVERAAEENEAWSAHRPAAPRYKRFREENFERLRNEAARQEQAMKAIKIGGGGGSNPSLPLGSSNQKTHTDHHSDWYSEWSQAATRRRHLDRLDDDDDNEAAAGTSGNIIRDGGGEAPQPGSFRRSCNTREWRRRRKREAV